MAIPVKTDKVPPERNPGEYGYVSKTLRFIFRRTLKVITFSKVRLSHGDRTLFRNADLLIRPEDRIGLVGPNGAGKSTVFRLIVGEESPDEGSVNIHPGKVVGYFSQDVGEMSGRTVMEETLSGAGRVFSIGEELSALEHRMGDPDNPLSDAEMDRYGELQSEFLARDGYDLETRAETVLTGLGIGEGRWSEAVENFSGGWKMRIALAKILLLNPDVLLIDEPTNHLDVETITWLEEWLRSFPGAIMMTSHDRDFMTRLCSRTIEVAAESITSYTGDYDFYLKEREIRREQLLAAYSRQQASIAKDEEFIARFAARASHAAQVQSRVKMLEKMERIVIPPDPKIMKLRLPEAKRSGDRIVEMTGLAKSWPLEDGRVHPVFSGITGTIVRGNRIALTGVNGAGKSTLLKLICEQTEATEGRCELGSSLEMGYFSQYSMDSLHPDSTIYDEVAKILPQASPGEIKSLLGAFQFSGDDVEKKVRILSGGEKSRVMLACMLAQPRNFLVLDEPTNHLDIVSREVLLEALQDFPGTIIIVSHDRYFLKHLVNRVFRIDHGHMDVFEGDYDYYLEKSGHPEG